MKNIVALLTVCIGFSASSANPYIAKVYDFIPAPGQFVNVMPEYEDGDDKDAVLAKVAENICGNDIDGATPGMISLGAWGGYVVFGFDHPVVNVKGEYDFKIYGNAFAATGSSSGGSCEPGIVMVSYDENGNGEPDDKWYELAGSEYDKQETIHDYKLTYYKPSADHVAEPDPTYKYITDRTYVKWEDNKGGTGYVKKNSFHSQNYWPEWIDDTELEFSGCRLADNAEDQSGNGSYYVLSFYDYGYVDNQPNSSDSGFKIDWAVDEQGNHVDLPAVHFIKVYSAINQYCGWIGETSTEIQGGEDLHPDAEMSGIDDVLIEDNLPIEYYNLQGVKVKNPSKGVFIKCQGGKTTKVIL